MKVYDLPYDAMTTAEIAEVPVVEFAEPDAWLFLWATNRYLPDAFGLIECWGFTYRQTLVWHKLGPSPFGGTVAANGAEFLLVGARGAPAVKTRWPGTSVITTNRSGTHSRKPAAFLDLIEHVADGPYLELFARRQRLGWDTWGDEALDHLEERAG